MTTFRYSAKDKMGAGVSGILEAGSDAEVAEILHKKELIVISIHQVKKKTLKVRGRKVRLDDLVVFSRQLATLIDAGIPLVQALRILSGQIENKVLKNVVIIVGQDIESGMSFCDALGRHPNIFSEFFINMTRAGEASGTLNEVLDRVATYLEKSAALSRKVKSSLVYPAVVVSMAIIITTVLLVKVVPTFKGIFDILGGELPLPTRILIGLSDLLRKYFLLTLAGLVILVFIFKKYISTEKGRYIFDSKKLKMPILGTLFVKVAVAKFSRTFATLVRSGVSILNALDIVSKTSGNKVVEASVAGCRTSVREGEPIAQPLSQGGVFPAMVCQMISVGEQTGQLEKMLGKIADFYEEQVDAAVAGLTSMIEPLVIAFLGVIIGGIVISLFLPIFKITQIIAK